MDLQFLSGSLAEFVSGWILAQVTIGVLVLIRLSGLFLIGPFFGHPSIPMTVRALLVFSLTLILMPGLSRQYEIGFNRLDTNENQLLDADEVPPIYEERYAQTLKQVGKLPGEPLTYSEFQPTLVVPSTIFDFAFIAIAELSLGFFLALGVNIVLSGIQMAGEMFDQQTGTALSEIFNPATNASSSPTGQTLYMLATVVFLVSEPINGHILMLSTLMETFQVLPVGEAWMSAGAVGVLRGLVQASLILAVQLAAPLLAVMALLSITMGFLGYTVPQVNVLVLGFPIRAMLASFILLFTLSGVGQSVGDAIPAVLDQIQNSFFVVSNE